MHIAHKYKQVTFSDKVGDCKNDHMVNKSSTGKVAKLSVIKKPLKSILLNKHDNLIKNSKGKGKKKKKAQHSSSSSESGSDEDYELGEMESDEEENFNFMRKLSDNSLCKKEKATNNFSKVIPKDEIKLRHEHKSHIDNVQNQHKSHIDNVQNQQNCNIDNVQNQQNSHIDNVQNQQNSHIDNVQNQQNCNIDNVQKQQNSHIDNVQNQQNSHIDNVQNQQNSHIDNVKKQQKSHIDNVQNQQKSHIDNVKKQHKSHIDNVQKQQKYHIDNVQNQQKSKSQDSPINSKKRKLLSEFIEENGNKSKKGQQTRCKVADLKANRLDDDSDENIYIDNLYDENNSKNVNSSKENTAKNSPRKEKNSHESNASQHTNDSTHSNCNNGDIAKHTKQTKNSQNIIKNSLLSHNLFEDDLLDDETDIIDDDNDTISDDRETLGDDVGDSLINVANQDQVDELILQDIKQELLGVENLVFSLKLNKENVNANIQAVADKELKELVQDDEDDTGIAKMMVDIDEFFGDIKKVKSKIDSCLFLLQKWKRVQTVIDELKAENFSGRLIHIKRNDILSLLTKCVCSYYSYSYDSAEYFLQLFNPKEAIEFFEANETQRPVTIRCNNLKIKRRDLANILINRGANVDIIESDWNSTALLVKESAVPIGATPEYLSGHYMLQALSSLLPVMVLNPLPGDKVLDMAAAPGGKTTYIAQLMKSKGIIYANDANKQRCVSLMANLARMGIQNCVVTNHDGRDLKSILPPLDKILLDAPCSGSGIIARDPSIKGSRGPEDYKKNALVQKELLRSAIDCLKVDSANGGIVVYSTCSVSIEENEEVIQYILSARDCVVEDVNIPIGEKAFKSYRGKNFHHSIALHCRRIWPHMHNMDGFFFAKIRKISNKKFTKEA